jgi:hypothetical protein
VGQALHRLPGAPGPGRALTAPATLLLASPDDYLLELERRDVEAEWRSAHPDGEVAILDPAPTPSRLVQELVSPSLFAPMRLIVVPNAADYLQAPTKDEVQPLTTAVGSLGLAGVSLLLAATADTAPVGALVDAIEGRGEVRWLPLPAEPKPWDDVELTAAQQEVLRSLLRREAAQVLDFPDVVEALLAAYGFQPRELVQAARSLLASGAPTVEEVSVQVGAGEKRLRDLEEALSCRDVAGTTDFFAVLAAGGRLVGFRGETVEADRQGSTVAGMLGRLLRQALAVRGHARRAGIASELDPRRCGARDWYQRTFKRRIHTHLAEEIGAVEGSPVGGLSPWQLHKVFRLAAHYEDAVLLDALAELAGSGAERDRGTVAVAALTAIVLTLVAARP